LKNNNIYTLIAFDFGKRRIGVAIGNTLTRSARPLQIIDAKDKKKCFMVISKVIESWSPDYLVVGLPIYKDGSTHPFSKSCSKFARQLSQNLV
jgi:putative Holliday junction resolvase